jgi:ferritin-like metal-binding protein YciE
MATTYESSASDGLRDLFTVALRNAHALEKQALAIMTPQVGRIENYPEVAERLRTHIEETNGQIRRLDELLADLDTGSSALKDMGLSLTGSMAAISHSFAGDEILKNSFANYAFEHFEIAAYKSLITLAEHGSFGRAAPLLEETLREEEAMAQWIEESLPSITRRYADLYTKEGSFEAKV